MLKNALRHVGAFLMSIAEAEPPKPASPQKRKKQFEQRGRDLVANGRRTGAPITAGTIQLLGLGEILSSVKDASPDTIERVRAIAETEIDKQLAPEDSYQLQGDDTYVICFAELDQAQAARVAETISARLKTLLKDHMPEVADAIEVDHFVGSVDAGKLRDNRPLADQLVDSLNEIREEAKAAVEQRRAALIRDAQILYRPMWYARKEVVSLYRCLLDGESGNSAIGHLEVLSSPEELHEALTELDCLVFARSMRALHTLLQKQATAIFVIPVHFHTLADKTPRDEYMKLCESIPESYRKFISFEIYGLPNEAPASRIEQIVAILQPYCKALAIEVPASYPRLGEIASPNLWAISFSLEGRADAQALTFAVRLVHAQNLRAIAHGVNSHGQLAAALEAGFDYLDGAAIIGSVEAPRGTFRFRPTRIPAGRPAALAG